MELDVKRAVRLDLLLHELHRPERDAKNVLRIGISVFTWPLVSRLAVMLVEAVTTGPARHRDSGAVTFCELYLTPGRIQLDARIQKSLLGRHECSAERIPYNLIVGGDAAWCIGRVTRVECNRVDAVDVARVLPEFRPDLHTTAVDVRGAIPSAERVATHCDVVIVLTDCQYVIKQQFRAKVPMT